MLDAEELYRRAQDAHRSGRHQAARGLLARASDRTEDLDLAGRIELALAYVEAETGDAAGGLTRCLDALRLPGLRPITYGMIWSQLALLRVRSGEGDQALPDFERAITLLEGDHEYLGRAYLNRANLHLQRHDAATAVDDLERALEELSAAGAEVQAAKAEHNLGYARLLTGDLVGALARMESAATVLAPLSAVSRAVGEQDRAEVLMAAGRLREAEQALQNAASAYGAQRVRRFQAECEFVLARTLLRHDPVQARVLARRAARRFAAHDSQSWAWRAEAVEIAAAIETGSRQAALLDRADRLAADLRGHGLTSESRELALVAVRLAQRRGDLDGATRRLGAVLVPDEAPITHRLLHHEVRADLATARGRPSRARDEVAAGLSSLHQWQASFGSLDLQSTLVGHGRGLAVRGLASAMADGRPELVYEWSERARTLVARVAPVRPPHDPEVVAGLTELRMLRDDEERRAELVRTISQHGWYGAGAGEVSEPVPLEELTGGLGDAALVAHVEVGGTLSALVVRAEGALVRPLGDARVVRDLLDSIAADLDMAASRTEGPMAEVIRASLARSLAWVGRTLVDPILPLVGDRRVVLTPSGVLAGTPWSLLPGLVGRPITIAPSATRWLELHSDAKFGTRVGLVAGPRVERAEEEVTRACRAWPAAEMLTGAAASSARVAELAQRVDLLHLAGHGRHSGENPLFSAVELADGPWFGYDIDALAHTPSTVVLSACELGRVSVRSGEEAVGMTAAWLHAGARHVLSSPALVADHVACEALARWHAVVAGGAAPAVALAEVGAEEQDGPPLPFLCFGAGW